MPRPTPISRAAMKPLLEPYGLSEAVRAGDTLYIAGQTGMDETGRIVEGGLKAQAMQAFRNIKAILELAGGGPEDLVQLTWFLVEAGDGGSFMEDALAVTAARDAVMPGARPASTAVRVAALLTPELLIEIQAVAAL